MAMSKWLAAAAFLAAVNLSGCTGPDKRTTTNNTTPNSMSRPGTPTPMGTNGMNGMPTNNGFGSTGVPMNPMNTNPNFRPISNGPGFSGSPMTGSGPAPFPTGGMDNNLVRTTAPNGFPANPAFPSNPSFPSATGPGFSPTPGMSGGGVPAPMPPYPPYNPAPTYR